MGTIDFGGKDARKRLLWDARTRLLLACAVIPAAIETAYLHAAGEAGDVTLLFTLLATVCSLLMALLPNVGGWAIVALWAARCVVPQATPFSILFCLLMAVTVMTYLNAGMALAAAVIAEGATAARIWLYPWDSSVFTIVCATAAFLMVAIWLGSMMSWREQQEIAAQERAELLHELADRELATQLHHSVANDLTTILLLARQLDSDAVRREAHGETDASESISMPNGGQSAPIHDSGLEHTNPIEHIDEAETISLIERTATESLVKVRALIAELDRTDSVGADTEFATARSSAANGDGHDSSANGSAPSACGKSRHKHAVLRPSHITEISTTELRELGVTLDERLHANGLVGETIISGEESSECTDERKGALLDILHEIVGNMMKYADPAAGYCIAITLGAGLATVSASNGSAAEGTAEPAHTGNTDSPALTGGTGLNRCRQAAESLGGEFTVSTDGPAWTALVRLPLI
ncbi:hypothetical protein [Bifidobacterium olomucense]|uniref:Signal transduction histidine kinase n=1 Tax=Bifidobacterium olomucense TaxID=2675324 RepID=A0A7Y0EZ51_9BIFI|nr:hypothetical protein [Bifidobacterium sp. DSM 109959]NMM99065.1 Signal transduction histidine kinase [Bifidobacterium sp. DSM 109959]